MIYHKILFLVIIDGNKCSLDYTYLLYVLLTTRSYVECVRGTESLPRSRTFSILFNYSWLTFPPHANEGLTNDL